MYSTQLELVGKNDELLEKNSTYGSIAISKFNGSLDIESIPKIIRIIYYGQKYEVEIPVCPDCHPYDSIDGCLNQSEDNSDSSDSDSEDDVIDKCWCNIIYNLMNSPHVRGEGKFIIKATNTKTIQYIMKVVLEFSIEGKIDYQIGFDYISHTQKKAKLSYLNRFDQKYYTKTEKKSYSVNGLCFEFVCDEIPEMFSIKQGEDTYKSTAVKVCHRRNSKSHKPKCRKKPCYCTLLNTIRTTGNGIFKTELLKNDTVSKTTRFFLTMVVEEEKETKRRFFIKIKIDVKTPAPVYNNNYRYNNNYQYSNTTTNNNKANNYYAGHYN